jgi:hypothetical protein
MASFFFAPRVVQEKNGCTTVQPAARVLDRYALQKRLIKVFKGCWHLGAAAESWIFAGQKIVYHAAPSSVVRFSPPPPLKETQKSR